MIIDALFADMAVLTSVCLTLVVLVFLVVFEARWKLGQSRRMVWVTKPLASAGFLATVLLAGALDSPFGQTVLIALTFGAIGDVLLITEGRKRVFQAGMAAFVLGHLAYCWALFSLDFSLAWLIVGAGIMFIAGNAILMWFLPNVRGSMKHILVVYVAVISAMVMLAVGVSGQSQSVWFALAAGMFAVSDVMIARNRFIVLQPINRIVGLPLYYAAQLIFALSVFGFGNP